MKMGASKSVLMASVLVVLGVSSAFADITIKIVEGDVRVSPYLYGRNIDGISDGTEEVDSTEQSVFKVMNEAGIRFVRANNGNNATRYNWRKKMTVHPDWYNNVYSHSWDITAQKILDNMPAADAMYAFQLTGYAASSTEYNFSDWTFYQDHGEWATSTLDLAGGGEVSDDGKTLVKAGDYRLYNEAWPADSTVGIIGHWRDELKYDMSRFQYWSMDNEMEIWNGTHGDLPLDMDPDFLVERYIDVAKKARAAWKDIKLTGPVVANEWQWCTTGASEGKSGLGKGEDRNYCWLEYFIKRLSEEQKSSGVRMLDVFDMHWYPTEKTYEERMNWHRVFFDTTYNYSGANGIKMVGGSWDNKQTKEYVFKRVNDWLDKYFGENHRITLGLTETDIVDRDDPMTTALTYASFLGTFMNHGVEIFTPWTWGDGMYEVVHLFSRYGHRNGASATSSNDSLVSAYATNSNGFDSLTVILVNRSEKEEQKVTLNEDMMQFGLDEKGLHPPVTILTLSGLTGETFKSHEDNALKVDSAKMEATARPHSLSLTLPPKSITAVLIKGNSRGLGSIPSSTVKGATLFSQDGKWFVNNSAGDVRSVQIFNALGSKVKSINELARGTVQLATESLVSGTYIIQVRTSAGVQNQKILLK